MYNLFIYFIALQYWEKAKFPFHAIPKLGALGIAGGTIKVTLYFVQVELGNWMIN
jgi:hypothetical protein